MKPMLCRTVVLAMTLSLASAIPAAAQGPTTGAVLTLPVSGSFRGGGDFDGTISINRFELAPGNQIVAVGFVRGVLSRGNRKIGTAVAGEWTWPVSVRPGGQLVVRGEAAEIPRPTLIAWSPRLRLASTTSLRPASALRVARAQDCGVLNLALGATTIDLLGVQVALSPVTLDLSGATGTPLGGLVCSILDTVVTVGELVNLLNGLLGLVTGLLGGLTGGLGGAVQLP